MLPMAGTNYWASMTTRNPNAGIGAASGHGSDGLGTGNTSHARLTTACMGWPSGPEAPGGGMSSRRVF